MKIVETKIVNIEDIVIGKYITRSVEQIEHDDDLMNLSKSMEEQGQLHACTVRNIYIGDSIKYELIAGGRRYRALKLANNSYIEVKIVDITDIEAMELGISENVHRKDPDINQRDKIIYDTWKLGKKNGAYKYPIDLAKKIHLSDATVRRAIVAGEEKEQTRYKDSEVFQRSTSVDLEKTRPLSNTPDIRVKILELENKGEIIPKDVPIVAKKIRESIKEGIDEDTVKKIVDSHKDRISKNAVGNIVETLDVIKESPPDMREKIIKKEISIDRAKAINKRKFDTPEERKIVIDETKIIEKQKEISAKMYDADAEMNLDVRKKQAEDIKKKGNTDLKTGFDLKTERKIQLEESYDKRKEEVFIKEYESMLDEVMNTIGNYHPRKLEREEARKTCYDIVEKAYRFLHLTLKTAGRVKDITIDANVKETNSNNDNETKVIDITVEVDNKEDDRKDDDRKEENKKVEVIKI